MNKRLIFLLAILSSLFFQGCLKDKVLHTYTMLKPIYKEKAEVYADIKSNPAAAIENPGKLFLMGNYIFLNEVDKGIHIIDNTDPSNPKAKAFINIPGNLDIAVKGNTLYADLYSDLVVVDITNPMDARFIKYIPRIFPERNYAIGFVADTSKVIVGWTRKDTTVRVNDNTCTACAYLLFSPVRSVGGGPSSAAAPTGIAGSMARFSVLGNYLYTVNTSRLSSFDITNTQSPVQTASQNVGWNIETIFPFGNKLFIGSMTGMFIYDLANPAVPQRQGQFSHMRSCDPVIADGNYAYVTLRGGTNCGGFTNQMDVVNISNMASPSLVKSYPLVNPHGLTKDNKLLFVCDGQAGLKMFDATDPLNISLKKTWSDMDTYDAIAFNGNLLVVAKDGLYQFSYAYPSSLNLRSKLPVNR